MDARAVANGDTARGEQLLCIGDLTVRDRNDAAAYELGNHLLDLEGIELPPKCVLRALPSLVVRLGRLVRGFCR